MAQRLLEGEVMESNGDASEMFRLRELNRTLTRELSAALEENETLKKRVAQADAPIARLRDKLDPFYRLLQAIYGDIDEIEPEATDEPPGRAVNPANSAVWDSWKQKLSGTPAAIISALQTHSDASTQQLAIICKRGKKAIYQGIFRLSQAGLINKNGGRFSLKQL